MQARSGVELMCRLAVELAGQTTIVFDSDKVDVVVADHYMMEDRVDRCSSLILHSA